MKSIQEDIRTGNFKHVYLLYGEETYLVQQYRNRLRNALAGPEDTMNVTVFQGKDIHPGELIDLAETMPFFAERRVLLVDNSGFFRKSPEELADYLDEIPETAYFIFSETEVDRRSRLFRKVKKTGSVVEFRRQTDEVLMKWVLGRVQREGKKITRPVMELFLSKTGKDMALITQELEKLMCYAMDRDVIEAEDVEAVCVGQIEGQIFEMVDAVGRRDQKRVLDLYSDLLTLKEPPFRILSLLERQFRILMQLKDMAGRGFDSSHMASVAGVPEFAVRKYIAQARQFTAEQLESALRDGVQADEDIKTGKLTDRVAVELFLIKYSGA